MPYSTKLILYPIEDAYLIQTLNKYMFISDILNFSDFPAPPTSPSKMAQLTPSLKFFSTTITLELPCESQDCIFANHNKDNGTFLFLIKLIVQDFKHPLLYLTMLCLINPVNASQINLLSFNAGRCILHTLPQKTIRDNKSSRYIINFLKDESDNSFLLVNIYAPATGYKDNSLFFEKISKKN